MATKVKFQVHLVLFRVEVDEETEYESTTLLEEEELAGYRNDFEDETQARQVFTSFSGIDVMPDNYSRAATRTEIQSTIKSYWDKTRTDEHIAFDTKDAEETQKELGKLQLKASIGQIIHVAQLMRII